MKLLKFSMCGFVLFMISACQSTSLKEIEQIPNNKEILVVSALGNNLSIRNTGVFSDELKKIDVSAWNIDSLIEYNFIKLAKSRFKFLSFKSDNTNEVGELITSHWDFSLDLGNANRTIFEKAINSGASYVLVFSTRDTTDSSPHTKGYGRYTASKGGNPTIMNFASMCSTLFDAKTQKQMIQACPVARYAGKVLPNTDGDSFDKQVELVLTEKNEFIQILVQTALLGSKNISIIQGNES
ncbi:MAG: hypothetical protein HRT54_22865 [Colwellia sp.]|nr:hypothetical protein [Colwellia sp.]